MPTLITDDFGQRMFRDTVWTKQPRATSPWERFSPLLPSQPATAFVYQDDFFHLDTAATNGFWTTVNDGGSGTIALVGPGTAYNNGWISIPTAASQNDYQSLWTKAANFVIGAGSPIAFEAYVNVTEAATNKASWFACFSSITTTGFLTTAGAPPAEYDGAVFWKATGAMSIKFQTSNATVQNSTSSLATAVSGYSYILGCYIDPNDGVTAKANYWLASVTGTPKVITFLANGSLDLTISGLVSMYFGFGVVAGSGSAETIRCDYVKMMGVRALL